MSDGGRLEKWKPVLWAVVVGAVGGGLGGWFGRSKPPVDAQVQVQADGSTALAAETESSVRRGGLPPGMAVVAPLTLTVRCAGAGAKAQVSIARLDESRGKPAWQRLSSAPTDDAGRLVHPLGAGAWLVSARASGNPSCAGADTLVTLKVGDPQPSVVIDLGPGRRIEGVVLEAGNSTPVEGALVQARAERLMPGSTFDVVNNEQTFTGTTDSFGRFALDAVFFDRGGLTASAQGFADSRVEVSPTTTGTLRIEMFKSARLRGVVRGGLPPVSISAPSSDVSGALANADGTFTLEVPAGDTLLVASSGDGQRGMLRVANLQSGEQRDGLEIKLAPAGVIRGTAVDAATGEPVRCAEVWARPESDDVEVSRTRVGNDGAFVLEGVPAGRYWVHAKCQSGEAGDVMGLEPGNESHVISMRAPAALAGQVVTRDGQPVTNAEVEVQIGRRMPVVALSDAQGLFHLDTLPPAVAEVQVTAGGFVGKNETVQLQSGAVTQLTLTVDASGTLTGKVHGKVKGMRRPVLLPPDDKRMMPLMVEADNSYRVELKPGIYSVGTWSHGGFTEQGKVTIAVGVTATFDVTIPSGDKAPASEWNTSAVGPGELGVSFENSMQGPTVSWVVEGGPALKAGVRVGDVVAQIDGESVRDSVAAFEKARGQPGSTADVVVQRAGKNVHVAVVRAGGPDPREKGE